MAYRIVYGPMPGNAAQKTAGSFRLHIMTAIFLVLFVLLVRQVWPEGTDMLRTFLLPGDPTANEQAVSSLIQDLRAGEAFADALTVFCRQIIENGQTSLH